jgi:hypothetical protein
MGVSRENSAALLGSLRRRGVELWLSSGQLRYRAPKGLLQPGELAELRRSRESLVALLQDSCKTDRTGIQPAPLGYSQQAYWNLYRLYERPTTRAVASLTRLHGRVNERALQESVAELVHRQDSLRTRIVVRDGTPMQVTDNECHYGIGLTDLSSVSRDALGSKIERLMEEVLLRPVDLDVGPLFEIQLLKIGDQEHLLILAMDHMIADGFSLSIALRDLAEGYAQSVRGECVRLPSIPVQMTDYACWQSQTLPLWLAQHGPYWADRLAGCGRQRFPLEEKLPAGEGWGTIPVRIGPALRHRLCEFCQAYHTTLPMSVFTAYAALVLRWCDCDDTIIQFQSDGRGAGPEIGQTVGYFASQLLLRIQLQQHASLIDLMRSITREYCRAHQHADYSYLAARDPMPDCARNSAFNWLPVSSPISLSHPALQEQMTLVPMPFRNPVLERFDLDLEPGMLLHDRCAEVLGNVHFPRRRFAAATLQRFAENFMILVTALVERPDRAVREIPLIR